jgi:hypothetical protein
MLYSVKDCGGALQRIDDIFSCQRFSVGELHAGLMWKMTVSPFALVLHDCETRLRFFVRAWMSLGELRLPPTAQDA